MNFATAKGHDLSGCNRLYHTARYHGAAVQGLDRAAITFENSRNTPICFAES